MALASCRFVVAPWLGSILHPTAANSHIGPRYRAVFLVAGCILPGPKIAKLAAHATDKTVIFALSSGEVLCGRKTDGG